MKTYSQVYVVGDFLFSFCRKPSSPGDDVMTMTIEFLRARLLSERAASKAAKHEADQLSKKVWPAHSGPSVLDMSSVKHFALGYNTISFT